MWCLTLSPKPKALNSLFQVGEAQRAAADYLMQVSAHSEQSREVLAREGGIDAMLRVVATDDPVAQEKAVSPLSPSLSLSLSLSLSHSLTHSVTAFCVLCCVGPRP